MPNHQPTFVTINDMRVKVQQWQHRDDRITLTTLVRGTTAGSDLLEQLQSESVVVAWEDVPPQTARPEIAHHQAIGDGAKTMQRIEMTLWLAESAATPAAMDDQSLESKLDRIFAELHALRAEVAELREVRRGSSTPMATPLADGRTMLDFDIESDDNQKHPVK